MFRWIMQGVYPTYKQTQRLNVILHYQVMIYGSMERHISGFTKIEDTIKERKGGAYDGIKGILI